MEYYEGDNIGGLAKIEAIEHNNILSLDPLIIATGSAWFEIPFKEESGRMSPKSEMTANGRVFTYAGRFFLQRLRNEVDIAITPYLDDVAVLRITDMNGRVSIIGAPSTPVTIGESADTGQRYVNENGIEYTFTIDQYFRATTY